MIKKFFSRGFIGFGIAAFCGGIVALICYNVGVKVGFNLVFFSKNIFAYGLIGFTVADANMIFESEKFSLLTETLIHFSVVLSAYFIAGLIGGWFLVWGVGLLIPVFCFIASYIITWLSVMLALKAKTKAINNKLNESYKKNVKEGKN